MPPIGNQPRLLLGGVRVFDGRRTLDGLWDIRVESGLNAQISPTADTARSGDEERIQGGAVMPGLIDAHVHLSFSDPRNVIAGGVTAVLDLGEPLETAFTPHPPLRYRASGPLLTAHGGYPTQSWGSAGFGLQIAGVAAAREAVAMLADRGAAIIKLAVQGDPWLDPSTMAATVAEARRRGLQTVAHTLTTEAVGRALEAGVDALAHTPVEPLPRDVLDELGRRGTTVISTVRAFGAGEATRQNLRGLAGAGCRIVYGTDLGNNGIEPGADAAELAMLETALGSQDAALAAATSVAADFAGFPPARIALGDAANLIVAESLDYTAIARPRRIFIDGMEQTGA